MQPILLITVPIKKMTAADHQCCGNGDGVVRCEQNLKRGHFRFLTSLVLHLLNTLFQTIGSLLAYIPGGR